MSNSKIWGAEIPRSWCFYSYDSAPQVLEFDIALGHFDVSLPKLWHENGVFDQILGWAPDALKTFYRYGVGALNIARYDLQCPVHKLLFVPRWDGGTPVTLWPQALPYL